MSFKFFVDATEPTDRSDDHTAVRLRQSNWDDYGFGTTFVLSMYRHGAWVSAGTTKIARKGMTSEGAYGETHYTELDEEFTELGDEFFSVGQDASLYSTLVEWLEVEQAVELLSSIRDLAALPDVIDEIADEIVAYKSLFRSVTTRTVLDQYQRILEGDTAPQEFTLRYQMRPEDPAGPEMVFTVDPSWPLPSNVHVIIGSNGTGKTTTLRNIRWALDSSDPERYRPNHLDVSDTRQIAGLVSVSFSAFDVFPHQVRDEKQQAHFRVTTVSIPWFVGSHDQTVEPQGSDVAVTKGDAKAEQGRPNSTGGDDLHDDQRRHFSDLVADCLTSRRERLITVMGFLADADPVLASHGIRQADALKKVDFASLSSGHKIVLLTVASLVRHCEEKTLVLIDEPESHLHPPLLGAFTRALSWLMTDTNGLAIVATHSPVVLQEVPKRCAWKVWNVGQDSEVEQPSIETFGENLGVLTREVFGLELDKSGYHALLNEVAQQHTSYQQAIADLGGEIGDEAKLLLRAMIRRRAEG